jgi:2',3'-cyclic-nucleotide 2'-phosphodiesterase
MKELIFVFLGDVIGNPGIAFLERKLSLIKREYKADVVVVNGENSTKSGCGINKKTVENLKQCGVDVITTGNHVFDDKNFYVTLDERNDILRPINYPSKCPGKGYCLINVNGQICAIVNALGRVFIRDLVDCPFQALDTVLTFLKSKTNVIFVDFHAEATSEKQVFGYYLDGRVTGVFGTHTHVQSNDARILPHGTAFITDLGYVGALNSVIGFNPETIINKFTVHAKVGKMIVSDQEPMILTGVVVKVNSETGKVLSVSGIRHVENLESYKK